MLTFQRHLHKLRRLANHPFHLNTNHAQGKLSKKLKNELTEKIRRTPVETGL